MLAMAQQGCEMDTPEGRARFANQAFPLWSALPEGALQRQMLAEFARAAALPAQELTDLWAAMARHRSAAGGRSAPQGARFDASGGRYYQTQPASGLARSGSQESPGEGPPFDGGESRYPGHTGEGGPPPDRAYGPTPGQQEGPGRGRRSEYAAPGIGGPGSDRPRRGSWAERQALADPLRRGSAPPMLRRQPRSPADWVTQLLVKNTAWWLRLSADDLEVLHALPPPHEVLVRWLERDIEEHGPRPWAAVQHALAESADVQRAWTRMQVQDTDESEASWSSLRRTLDQLHLDRLQQLQTQLAARASSDPSALAEYQQVFERWKTLKQTLALGEGDGPATP
jgi:DNA primase